jgi:hypothetical protein
MPDGTAKGGNTRGMGAVDFQTSRLYATQIASGNYSIISGFNNTSSGSCSVAMGVNNNSSGNQSVAMGNTNTSSSIQSIVLGSSSTASGVFSVALGLSSIATGDYSIALGTKGHTNGISSKLVIGTSYSGSSGTYQMGQLGVGAITTDATATVLKSDTAAVSSFTQCTLQNNNAIAFTVEVVARNTSTGMAGRWEAKGLIKRGANASTTALVGTPTVTLTNADNEAWIVAGAITITADTTNGALAVTVTGAASTTIHWMAKILSTEIV